MNTLVDGSISIESRVSPDMRLQSLNEISMKAIEKGIPIPNITFRYPVKAMEIGDSFSLSLDEFDADKSCIRQYGYDHGRRFSFHRQNGAYRVWRVK